MDFGDALKYQREIHGLSQSKLAKETGLKQQMISHWEANKGLPNIEFCVILADYYNISMDELIGRDYGRIKKAVVYNHSTHNGNNNF